MRSHSRSASWSFTQTRRGGGRGLAAFSPLTSVLRDIVVPSFTESSQNLHSIEDASAIGSRTVSQVSLNIGSSFDDELNDNTPLLMQERHWPDNRALANRGPLVHEGRFQGEAAEQDAGDVGVEISDGVRWLEHNAVFIVLLLTKFAWYHRSGK